VAGRGRVRRGAAEQGRARLGMARTLLSWWRFRKSSGTGRARCSQVGYGRVRSGRVRQGEDSFELVAFANCHGTAPSGGAWRDRARRGMAGPGPARHGKDPSELVAVPQIVKV
jgi:hypothetical protein